jgi:hypothetical protein
LDREQALNATICRPRRFSSLIPAATIQRLSEHHIFLGSSRYDYYWFLGGRAALNQLDSPRKLGKWPFVTAIAFPLVQLVLVMLSVGEPFRQLLDGGGELVLSAARLALAILTVVQAFKVRDILEDHMMGPEDDASHHPLDAADVSGLLTFFFGVIYLQYVINRKILHPMDDKRVPPHAVARPARA